MSNLPMVWTKHLRDEKEKQKLESALRNNTVAHTRLIEILKEWELDALRSNKRSYERQSWAYFQAHQNGRAEALREVIDLFNFIMEK